jgi:competence protein ComEA
VDDRATLHAAAWAVAAVAAVLLGLRLLAADPTPPAAEVVGAGPAARPQRAHARAGPYVHVAGAVRRPGLYRLGAGARVASAVRRAGGAAADADLTAINLAAPLQDGQQVVVPALAPAAGSSTGTGAGRAGADPPVSLGTATAEELDGLDGIGPTLAERIVEFRTQQGGFRSLDQLGEVDGIGAKRLESLKAALTP